MIVLQAQNVTKTFQGDAILEKVKLEVQDRDRIALVGRNGAGKSTLLKLLTGELAADEGDVIMPKGTTFGYMEQHTAIDSDLTIWEEMLHVFSHHLEAERELRRLEREMADPAVYEDAERYPRVLAAYDELQVRFKDSGGYRYESDIRTVLHGLRFYPADYEAPISSLSGGQKTRLALAKLLLINPSLLILDEPTNHLDIETLTWLEGYLSAYEGALLIVSHDRYFLDQVASIVYEVSRHKVKRFEGNYSAYLDAKARAYESEHKLFAKQQAEKAKLEDFVQRNLVRASTTKMAQSRRKVLEKTDWMEAPEGDEKSARFGFAIERQSGNDVLEAEQLAIGYGADPVSQSIQFRLHRKDRLALVGPNGAGKSTLLKTIVRDLPPLGGTLRYGAHVQLGYYDQEQARLSSSKTVLQELWDEWPLKTEREIRTALGQFLFSGDDVLKIVDSLSGGEKARLALAKLMLLRANTLLLDEPTNHLDLNSKEVLENALLDYPGTILFVSHDRYFINRLADRVLELTPQGTTEFLGDYDYYVEKKAQQTAEAQQTAVQSSADRPAVSPSPSTANGSIDREAKKRERAVRRQIEDIETRLAALERKSAELEQQLSDPLYANDHIRLMEWESERLSSEAKHDALSEQWLEAQEQLEQIESERV